MAKRQLPDQALLLKLLRYDPLEGKLYWRERTPGIFPSAPYSPRACKRFNTCYAGKEAFTAKIEGYGTTSLPGFGALRAHRVIWCMMYGDWPLQVGHEDQDHGNNRLRNLFSSDYEKSGRNARLSPRNHSGRVGVNWNAQRRLWRAKIRHDGAYIELGTFELFADAVEAREAAEKLYGYSQRHGTKKVQP